MKIRILMDKGDGTKGMDKFVVHKETLEFEKIYLGKFQEFSKSRRSDGPTVRKTMFLRSVKMPHKMVKFCKW